jgi:CRISPR-associated protein Cmr4
MRGNSAAAWLFGSVDANHAAAGALLFSEARVLAFPIRSAKGSYAWITCPLMLQRAKRDGVISSGIPTETKDDEAIFKADGPLALSVKVKGVERTQVVLEEYTFTNTEAYPESLAKELTALLEDELFKSIADRLVILSNGMMSHFVSTTCEIAQHVRISDETGTAEEGGLFNQENVPSETLFYSVLTATKSRVPVGEQKDKPATAALGAFEAKLKEALHTFQFGGDASTGLGFCTVTMNSTKGA